MRPVAISILRIILAAEACFDPLNIRWEVDAMTTYYVDSNATGLDNGSSWANAWTSIGSITAVSAGDTVLVSSSHSETNAHPNVPSSSASPVKIISASTSTNLYQRGASLTGVSFDGHSVEVYGFDITTNNILYFNWGSHGASYYEDCNFTINHTARFTSRDLTFESCSWDQSAGSVKHEFWEATRLTFSNSSIATRSASEYRWAWCRSFEAIITLRSCEIGSITNFIESNGGDNVYLSIENCNHSVANLFENVGRARIVNSHSGSISSPAIFNYFSDKNGQFSTSTTEYRSDGADNGSQGYSLKRESLSSPSLSKFDSFPIARYVGAGSQTITVYLAGGASLNDDDFWIEVESPSELASPTAQGKFRTTKPDPLATPAALTSDTSSWTGSGVGTKQKIEVAISPTIAGTVTVRCYLAKPSTTVYVDPKISTNGNQRVFDGVLVDGDPTTLVSPKIHPLG
jgi:hypothetical protein